MEIDQLLFKVQGVLKQEQRLIGTLNTVKIENVEDISKVIGAVRNILSDNELKPELMRRLYLLLFLNTNSNIYDNLKKNRKLAHLVGFLPKLSPDLFMEIVKSLNLNQYMYESVRIFPPVLSYQVLEMCLNALNYLDLFEALGFVESLVISVFGKIVSLDEKDMYCGPLKDMFQRLLLYFDPNKSGTIKKMSSWKSSRIQHYAGIVIASLLSILENCTEIYSTNDAVTSVPNELSLYNIHVEHSEDFKPSTLENVSIDVTQCYGHVLSKCHENVNEVTVDVWLFWVEIDLDNDPGTTNTLQKLVGERAYNCKKKLEEFSNSGVLSKKILELINKLESISIEPVNHDKENSLMLIDVLRNVEDPVEDKVKWLKVLINSPDFIAESDTLEVLKKYVGLLETADLLKLSETIFSFIKTNDSCIFHKTFVLELIQFLDAGSQLKIAKIFLDNFGQFEVLKNDEFQPLFVETFNKIINEEDKEKEVYGQLVSLALQSGKTVVMHAVAESIVSEVRGRLMADVLARIQPFCDWRCDEESPLLVSALDLLLLRLPDLPENQHKNYTFFVGELVKRKSLDGKKFIEDVLLKKIHIHLECKNLVVLTASLQTISVLFDINCMPPCLQTLVMLLVVLQNMRWTPTTFKMAAVNICEVTLQLISQFVSKWFEIGIEDITLKNMTALVNNKIEPINRFHLNRLLPKEPMPVDDSALCLLYRMHYGIGEWSIQQITPDERIKLVYSLCFVLPSLLPVEWQELFCVVAPQSSEFFILFNIVTDSLMLCLDSSKVKKETAVLSCINYAIINCTEALQHEMTRWTKTDNEYRINALVKLCQLISAIPVTSQDAVGMILIKVLQELLPESNRGKPLTTQEMNKVTVAIASIQAPRTQQILAKEFLEMVHY